MESVTALGPTNMNHLETGVSNATTTADAAIPAPIGPASNAGLVWNGSSWVAATIVNANINAAAAIAYSKLSLAGSIVNNDVSASAAIAYTKLNLASSIVSADIVDGTIVNADISASAAIAQSKLANGPGFLIGHDQITSPVTVSSSTESSGTTVITCGAHTFDGAAAIAEFFSPSILTGTADAVTVCLFEGATQIGRFCVVQAGAGVVTTAPGIGKLQFTPSAASHTYTVTAFRAGANSGTIGAGASGTGAFIPAYVRFTKV